MKTITKPIDIYEFKELDKNIQQKLIEKEIETQNELYCENFLQEDMTEKAKELLQKYFKNATFKNVYYDLSYSQGSGAMIEFELYYYNELLKIKQYGHYFHERSFIIENDYTLTEKRYNSLHEKIVKMNQELAYFGYESIENYITEAEATEFLSENEYTKDGKIFIE